MVVEWKGGGVAYCPRHSTTNSVLGDDIICLLRESSRLPSQGLDHLIQGLKFQSYQLISKSRLGQQPVSTAMLSSVEYGGALEDFSEGRRGPRPISYFNTSLFQSISNTPFLGIRDFELTCAGPYHQFRCILLF